MKFDKFVNKHIGERCFILGNAPSLAKEDLTSLKKENVFIVNRGYLARDLGLQNYTYYVCADENVYNSAHREIQETVIAPRFYHYKIYKSKFYAKEDYIPIKKSHSHKGLINGQFPKNFNEGWGNTRTVAFDASLIAYFMGFSKIYLLGVDLYHPTKDNSHFYKVETRENKSFGAYHRRTDEITTLIGRFADFFQEKNIVFKNLSRDFAFKNYMQTDLLDNL